MNYNDGSLLGSDQVWTSEDKAAWANARRVEWTEPGLTIVRVALIGHYWPLNYLYDVSYVLGMVGDEPVYVKGSPFDYWNSRTWKTDLYKWGVKHGVNIKKMGLYGSSVIRWGV